ncbi:hypothetical protein I4U23_012318 [Adineta vaga]|nr:hypothetical protein I4U23_012318 [Adineta vaga]
MSLVNRSYYSSSSIYASGCKHHIGLSSLRKRRKWLIDIVINERIGKDKFIEELLKEGDEKTLELFGEYAELTTPLSVHLISEYHKNKNLSNKQHLSLLRYQFMTEEVFNQFLTLFNQISSNPNQREQFYILFFQCAVATNDIEQVTKVFQWIQNRFTNERFNVIETFLRTLPNYDNQFQLEFMPKNFDLLESIIELVLKRFPQINISLNTIANYSSLLLQRVESHPNQDQRETIQTFAIKTIKRFLASSDCTCFYLESFSSFQPKTCQRIADILVSELFTKLLSKHMLNDLTEMLRYYLGKSRYIPAIDLFIESFFLNHLPLSTKLQSAFCIDAHSLLISSFLKNRSTKVERVKQLIEKFDTFFFLDKTVQRIALYSQQYRQIIDQLIEDDKCLTFDKLSNNQTNFLFKTNKLKYPGLDIHILNSAFCYLTGNQQGHISKIILHEFLLDKDVTNPKKIKALRILHNFTHVFDESFRWFNEKQSSSIDSINIDPLEHILLCVPITFDLTFEDLVKQMNLLTMKINASNAKYISDAMLSILRRIPEEIFLTNYLQFIHSEQFQKLGITANKEILRLLTEFTSDSSLITSVIEPLWNSRLHPDVRACLILTLLYFMDKLHSEEEKTTVWKILEEAANDDYLPAIQCLFSASRGNSRWPLSKLMDTSNKIFQIFVDRIQFKILDHPTSLEARLWAWTNIESEHCNTQKLMEKSIQLCTEFNKEANTLWGAAFDLTIARSSVDIIATVLQKLMSFREEIDGKENGLDAQHDLPVYHRIQCILTKLISRMYQYSDEKKLSFHSLTLMILEFDKTLAPLIGKLLINIAKNKEDLEEMLILFQENLSEDYFERIVKVLGTVLSKSCSLIQQLTVEDKLNLVQWFIEEKKRELFVFEFFKNHLLNQSNSNREQCQNLLRLLRQNGDLYLRQQAMEYTVRWKRKKEKSRTQQKHERKATPKMDFDPDISDLNMLGIFDTIESQ